jgi:glycosyltransferase involved in cell wall biosynthesis
MTLISFAIPCHNRLHDLRRAMPYMLEAANASPPVEIFVLDYASTDGLYDYLKELLEFTDIAENNQLSFKHYEGRTYFHRAHAFNLAVLNSGGEYFCLLGADAIPAKGYVLAVRKLINDGCIWGHASNACGIIFCKRDEFIDAGGYDERFEFYGGEDRELEARLQRRGGKFGFVQRGLMRVIQTSNEDKIKNHRLQLSKHEMIKRTHVILDENNADEIMVANINKEWGKWI